MPKDIPPFLSIVLPVYNEKDTLPNLISDCIAVLRDSGLNFEIVAVDDCSNDGTDQVLQDLKSTYPSVIRVHRHPYNKGNGSAIKSGIRTAKGEWICCMDADGQHDPRDIFEMLKYTEQYDLVVGVRPVGKQQKYREFANAFYNRLASWLTGFKIEDLTSGFRLFKGSLVKLFVPLFPSGFSYPTTSTLVMLKTGHNVKYVPINIRPRQGGRSKIHVLNDGWKFVLIILKIFMLFDPIRIFLFISLVFFLLSGISFLDAVITLKALHIPNSSVLFFLVGVLVLSLGFISEQIASLQLTLLGKNE
ncbi:MAG: glycosyltransferase family 2 protein [Anaerolineales bacterium]